MRIARLRPPTAVALAATLAAAGCGVDAQSPDLFKLTRTGPGRSLSILINDSGTVTCNGAKARPLPDPLLLQARDLAASLDNDAKQGMHIPPRPNSVYHYRVELPDGTITFPDTAGNGHTELAQAQQLVLAVVQGPCAG